MILSPQQEAEVYPILDSALAKPPGKAVLYNCTTPRAGYLSRLITGLRYDSAIESIETYTPGEALYGLGLYSTLWAEPHEEGLLVANFAEPPDSLAWRLIQARAHHTSIELIHTVQVARTRLIRMQKKQPIMRAVWIETGPPVRACYGETTTEELVIVDIDYDPTKILHAPTPEDYAKARMVPPK
jgi:hypothetical protein